MSVVCKLPWENSRKDWKKYFEQEKRKGKQKSRKQIVENSLSKIHRHTPQYLLTLLLNRIRNFCWKHIEQYGINRQIHPVRRRVQNITLVHTIDKGNSISNSYDCPKDKIL